MKTLCFTLLLVVFNFSLTAQIESDVTNNMKYIDEVVSNSESSLIKKFQNMAAYYNIEHADGYTTKKKSTYDVVFNETNCKIEATYNSEGEILNSNEVYLNMRLPLSLTKLILNENKKWYVTKNIQKVFYNNNSGVYRVYEVEIKKDNTLKKLKFRIDSDENNNAYVALH